MDLRAEINKILSEYADEVDKVSTECVRKVALKGAKELRNTSPKGRSSDYAKGWSAKTEVKRLSASSVIYNKNKPGLAHLLEHGHVTRNGLDRTYPKTPAHVHIEPVETSIAEEFEQTLRRDLGG